MATYAIGDIQGCYQTFQALLKKIQFSPDKDCLWLAGDMINRGKNSLQVLSFIYEHQEKIHCVLGNHDLHFLAVVSGAQNAKPKDTFDDILNSSKCDDLVNFLIKQPLFYYDKKLNFAMVHAGVPFDWNLKQTQAYSQEVSDYLQSNKRLDFFAKMYGDEPSQWKPSLSGIPRLRYITNALTRMRYCQANGQLELTLKTSPDQQAKNLIPWYELSKNQIDYNLVFGHWASLQGKCPIKNFYALDTGCVWNGQLTALRLDDKKLFACQSIE